MFDPKTKSEIQAMRDGGKILACIFDELRNLAVAGISEREINDWVNKKIKSYGAEPTYLTDEVKFPGSICISTNDQIVHSIPTEYKLKNGDIVGFDLVITYQGMKVDSAFSMCVGGNPDAASKHLLKTTERSLYAGIDAIKGPVYTGDIGEAIEKILSSGKLGIVRELVGHGIGHSMHQAPEVPNYGIRGKGVLLNPGDTIAIEPMATLGTERIKLDDDGWTIKTADGSLAAHFEHTVLVLEDGVEILTQL